MSEPVLYQQDGAIATLTLNRPETRNVISEADMIAAVEAAVERINQDLTVRVAIITGAGSAFSAGGNIKQMQERSGMFAGSPAALRDAYRYGIQRIPRALHAIEAPTIAAVNGPAVGAGCDLALLCDIRIASEQASFAASFVRLGIIPGDGGAWLLPRAVGLARACEMLFSGDPVDAQTALAWGLVANVVAPDQLMVEAKRLAERIAVNPPLAIRMTKKLIREGQRMDLESLLELSAAMQALAHHSQDHTEAVAALLEKRAARFTGE